MAQNVYCLCNSKQFAISTQWGSRSKWWPLVNMLNYMLQSFTFYPNHTNQNWLKIILTKTNKKPQEKQTRANGQLHILIWFPENMLCYTGSHFHSGYFPLSYQTTGEHHLASVTQYMHLHNWKIIPQSRWHLWTGGWKWIFFSLWRICIILGCLQ